MTAQFAYSTTESPGWLYFLLSGVQQGVVSEQRTRFFLDETMPDNTFQEQNDNNLDTNWWSVCGNRLEQAWSNFPLDSHKEDIEHLTKWDFSTECFTEQIHSHQAASVNRQTGQRAQNLERC